NATWVLDLAAGTATPYFFTQADLNSANVVLTAPLAALGLDPGQQFTYDVYAFDNYFTGSDTDAVEGMTVTLDTPRYAAEASSVTVNPRREVELDLSTPAGGAEASPSQTGFLLLYEDCRQGRESQEVVVCQR